MTTRRLFLAGAAVAAGLPRLALAAAPGERRFVLVLLRGGMDGIAAFPPLGDRKLPDRRGALAPDPATVVPLDGYFALHPALAPLKAFWDKGELALAPAVAHGYRTRSHFDAQDLLEEGAPKRSSVADGWLNRVLAELPRGERRLGLAVGGSVPLVLRGPVPVASWEPPGLKPAQSDLVAALQPLYASDRLLGPALAEALKAQAFSTEVMGGGEMKKGGRGFGPNALKPLAEAAGRLLAAKDGPRIAVLELGGWDTHAGEAGRLPPVLAGFANGMESLAEALGPAWRQTAVVAMTEFGRTVAVNGSGGTDHGTGSAMLLLGGAIKGKRIVGDWPGLVQLEEGRDLRPTLDGRAVLKGVLHDHLGIEGARIFPGVTTLVGGLVRSV